METVFCYSYGVGYNRKIDECRKCLKQNRSIAKKCRSLTKKLITNSCSSEKEIADWLIKFNHIPKNIDKNYRLINK